MRDLRGVAAVVLALGIVLVLVLSEIFVFLNPNRALDTSDITIVAGVVGAAVGALATYLGNQADKRE